MLYRREKTRVSRSSGRPNDRLAMCCAHGRKCHPNKGSDPLNSRGQTPYSVRRLTIPRVSQCGPLASERVHDLPISRTEPYARATWAEWTGYSGAELSHCRAPFPFWVSHRDLTTLSAAGLVLPAAVAAEGAPSPTIPPDHAAGCLPFRHRDQSLFWCQVDCRTEAIEGRRVTIAVLRRFPRPTPVRAEAESETPRADAAKSIPGPHFKTEQEMASKEAPEGSA